MRTQTPHPVFDEVISRLRLKNDAALSRMLGIGCPTISKIRNRRIAGRDAVAVAIHEVCGMSFDEMRQLGGPNFVPTRPPARRAAPGG